MATAEYLDLVAQVAVARKTRVLIIPMGKATKSHARHQYARMP
jgi:hypothetical protein